VTDQQTHLPFCTAARQGINKKVIFEIQCAFFNDTVSKIKNLTCFSAFFIAGYRPGKARKPCSLLIFLLVCEKRYAIPYIRDLQSWFKKRNGEKLAVTIKDQSLNLRLVNRSFAIGWLSKFYAEQNHPFLFSDSSTRL